MRPSALHYSLVFILLICSSLVRAEVSATVDRSEVSMDESFTLTLTVSELRVFSQPDLEPLETDFHILNTSQSSNTSIVNGKLSSSTNWTIQLMPKRPGNTSIPPLKIGKESTGTIELVVTQRGSNTASDSASDDVMLEAELSRNTAYVSEQVLLTLRVSMAQPARFQLEEPELDSAIVQQVAEASYQQVRDGRRFQVTEYTFAIFAADPGELLIPPLNLVAEMMSSRPRSMFDPMLGQSKRILRRTEPLTLNVLATPDGISRVDWLPANEVSLTQQWSSDLNQLELGDSITRTIELEGHGVMAAQLPPLFMPKVPGLKMYPDQPVASDEKNATGITGKRVERIAVVATEAGSYTIPEQQLKWWNVETNSMEIAVLPEVRFDIAPAANPPGGTASPAALTSPDKPETTATPPSTPAKAWYSYGLWWSICGFLLLLCLVLGILYALALRRLKRNPQETRDAAQSSAAGNEEQAYQRLRTACTEEKPTAAYHALQAWCREHWQDRIDVDKLASHAANQQLVTQATALQRQLYSNGHAGNWNAGELLSAVDQERKKQRERDSKDPNLPPLYPSPIDKD